MTLSQLVELAWEHPVGSTIGLFLLGTVTVKKLDLPVWQWFLDWFRAKADAIGKALTVSVMAEIGKLNTELGEVKGELATLKAGQAAQQARADQDKAERFRELILRFNLEIINGMHHDREQYVEILEVIDWYREYCRAHEKFPNGRADAAMRNITIHYDFAMKAGFPLRGMDIIKEVN